MTTTTRPRSAAIQKALDLLVAGEWLSGTDFAREYGTYSSAVNEAVKLLAKQGHKVRTKRQGTKVFHGVKPGSNLVPVPVKPGSAVVPFRWLDIPQQLPVVGQLVQVTGVLHSSVKGSIVLLRSEDGQIWQTILTDMTESCE